MEELRVATRARPGRLSALSESRVFRPKFPRSGPRVPLADFDLWRDAAKWLDEMQKWIDRLRC
jgi:hypothetical protein